MLVSILASFLCVKKFSENNSWKCPVAYNAPRRNQREVLAFSSTPLWTPKPDSKAYQSTAAGKQERVACFLCAGAYWSDQNQGDDGTVSVFTFA